MVSCRSCGRNITSGAIRCTQCSTPFHLSCSHRYKISPNGVFNVCCGSENIFSSSGPGYQMRTRRNKRRLNTANNISNSIGGNQNNTPEQTTVPMRFAKIQKVDVKMVADDKPVIIEQVGEHYHEESQQDFTNDDYNNIELEVRSNESITILDDEQTTETNTQVQNINANANDQHNITLETVWEGISSLQSSISNISNSLDTVSNHLNTFDPRINELESTLNTIKTKTNNLENVQNDMSGLREELSHVTNELEKLKTMQEEKAVDMSTILIEVKEREVKSRNILIYNVPEDNLRISQDYSTLEDINKFNDLVAARDTSRAREILQDVPNIDLDEIITRRLGRIRINFCRPLRVTFRNKDDVITVMKNKSRIAQQYSVKTDLTKLQQKKIKELKEELDKINVDKANPTMTIKFINGEPQLVPLVGGYFKRE